MIIILLKGDLMDKNITILVNSCDLYEEAWHPFFKLMEINWPESKNYKIVLHTFCSVYSAPPQSRTAPKSLCRRSP